MQITTSLTGNLVEDPTLRLTPAGQRLIARLEDGRQDGAVKGAGTATSRGPVAVELTLRPPETAHG